jgi:hypothetical protein
VPSPNAHTSLFLSLAKPDSYFGKVVGSSQLPSRCNFISTMCFRDTTDDERNVWLTVRDGRVVAAPPVVYVPGLRRIQEKLHDKARRAGIQSTDAKETIRVPAGVISMGSPPYSYGHANGSLFPPMEPIAVNRPRSPTDGPVQRSSLLAGSPGKQADAAERACQDMGLNLQQENYPGNLPLAQDALTQGPRDSRSAESNISSASPSASSASSASSGPLRSILKRPLSSPLENANSFRDSFGDSLSSQPAKEECSPISEQPQSRNSRKSVSFAIETGSPPEPDITAAEKGASIAKELVRGQCASERKRSASISREGNRIVAEGKPRNACRKSYGRFLSPQPVGFGKCRGTQNSVHGHDAETRYGLSHSRPTSPGEDLKKPIGVAACRSEIGNYDDDDESDTDDKIESLWSPESHPIEHHTHGLRGRWGYNNNRYN